MPFLSLFLFFFAFNYYSEFDLYLPHICFLVVVRVMWNLSHLGARFNPGKPCPVQGQLQVLTTGPPGNSLHTYFLTFSLYVDIHEPY